MRVRLITRQRTCAGDDAFGVFVVVNIAGGSLSELPLCGRRPDTPVSSQTSVSDHPLSPHDTQVWRLKRERERIAFGACPRGDRAASTQTVLIDKLNAQRVQWSESRRDAC